MSQFVKRYAGVKNDSGEFRNLVYGVSRILGKHPYCSDSVPALVEPDTTYFIETNYRVTAVKGADN